MKEKTLESIFVCVSLAVMTVCVGLYAFWSLYPYEILIPQEGNYELTKTVFEQGESLTFYLRVCKTSELKAEVSGEFVDGIIYQIPPLTAYRGEGCYDQILSGVRIPENLPAGEYHYHDIVEYQVNPIKTVTYSFQTDVFEVVE